jgi:glyoxylase-like metal-dependent hydrolase (beta-lactamase superfamily II)
MAMQVDPVSRPHASASHTEAQGAGQIAPDVYRLNLSGPTQTNVYLVRDGASLAVIDTGWPKDGAAIAGAARAAFGAAHPGAILLTHVHPDHAGSALELARAWGCPVYVHRDELPIAMGDFDAMIADAGPLDRCLVLPLMRAMGRRRREAMISRSSLRDAVQALGPGGEVPGLPSWQYVQTPGHTRGHVSFFRLRDRVLITGDAVVTLELNSFEGLLLQRQRLSGPPWYTSWSWTDAEKSVAALAALEPNVLATGHGLPLTGAGTAQALRAFAQDFATGARATR